LSRPLPRALPGSSRGPTGPCAARSGAPAPTCSVGGERRSSRPPRPSHRLARPRPVSEVFADRRVFITGGSSGIGKALAGLLLDQGAHVCIAARGQARLDEALTDLRPRLAGPTQRLTSVALDVGDREAVEQAVPTILDALGGRVDLLIN